MGKKEPLYPHVPKSRKPETIGIDIRSGDLVKSRVWERGTVWLTVIGGPYPMTWAGKQWPITEFEVTDGLTKNRVFADTIIDHIRKH